MVSAPFKAGIAGSNNTLISFEPSSTIMAIHSDFINTVPEELSCTPQLGRAHSHSEIRALVQACVHRVLEQTLDDESNIFDAGADSLCPGPIRNAITHRLVHSGIMDDGSIQLLIPRNIVYILPSIKKLSAFIYGIVFHSQHDSEEQTAVLPESNRKEISAAEVDYDDRWLRILESNETVTEISQGNGVPLIILHGAGGNLYHFSSFMSCNYPVWGVRVTDETPLDSVESWANYYFLKIKEKRLNGPYRLASFSGSCVLLLELVQLFQRNGDYIIQFTMLDHFPTFFFPNLNPDMVDLTNPEWFQSHLKQSLEAIMQTLANGPNGVGTPAAQRYKELQDAMSGGPMSQAIKDLLKVSSPLIWTALKYMLSTKFMEETDVEGTRVQRWSPTLFLEFVSGIIPRLSVYVADSGIRIKAPTHLMDSVYEDLGARRYFPNPIIKHFDSGHLDMLENEELLRDLEREIEGGVF